ncbi:MAG: hypothetical protein A4E55_01439 [Pelotomaculum sp. PtaU1.Bin035]|nr:MAG: hypothetical protein A4E55_01439 [Pelotomaculum sp. PtaU1.Bin035]
MIFEPRGLATGIGSMPCDNPGSAWSLIKKYLPDIPHWPQLPLRGRREHFVNQSLKPLVKTGLLTDDGDKIYFDTTKPDWADNLTEFYSIYLACEEGDRSALNEFALPQDAAAGFHTFLDEMGKETGSYSFLKGQVVGPLTVALQAKDEQGRFAYYNEQLRDLIVKTLAMHAAWQADELGRFGRPVMIFVDEPALGVVGQSGYITITREMIKEDLGAIFNAIHETGGLAGLHSCDAIDWSILFESELEVVSFDAYNYFRSMVPFSSLLKAFLNRGGALAWGLVPTMNDRALDEDVHSLLKILDGEWSELLERGVPRDILVRRCLFTPACGTGLLDPAVAERIYKLAALLSENFREREGLT